MAASNSSSVRSSLTGAGGLWADVLGTARAAASYKNPHTVQYFTEVHAMRPRVSGSKRMCLGNSLASDSLAWRQTLEGGSKSVGETKANTYELDLIWS